MYIDYTKWEDVSIVKGERLRAYSLLAVTILFEGIATMLLRLASDKGFVWLAFAYCFYGGAFAIFPEVLKVVNVGEA